MQNKIITFNKPLYLGSEKKLIDRIYGSQKYQEMGKYQIYVLMNLKKNLILNILY